MPNNSISNKHATVDKTQNDSNNKLPPIHITKNNNSTSAKPKWIIKTGKRPGVSPKSKGNKNEKSKYTFSTPSRFDVLSEDDKNGDDYLQMHTDIMHQPPTLPQIFINTPVDYLKFCAQIKTIIGNEEYLCKPTTKNLKLSLNSPQYFRLIIKLLNNNSIEYYTYQAKENKSYRVVLKNLHHTNSTEFITQKLSNLGYSVRHITNIKKKSTQHSTFIIFHRP